MTEMPQAPIERAPKIWRGRFFEDFDVGRRGVIQHEASKR